MFTPMRPKEQQTSDNLIVKNYYFIIEIFDKFSFSGILRGCLTLNRPGFFESSTAGGGGGGRIPPPCVISLFEDQ